MNSLAPLTDLSPSRFETPTILKKAASAGRALAEMKGLAASIPNQEILINTLGMQEAKDSSEIENIVTTHDELFKGDILLEGASNAAAKEVLRYRQALRSGYEAVLRRDALTVNQIISIQSIIEENNAGLRKLPGTVLRDERGQTVYTPPQDHDSIVALMRDLERFLNDDEAFDSDPLVKMSILHYQFESIHPFYDGNGRTGRILCVLYLVQQGLLGIPILYLSRYIVRNKSNYYQLLQNVREKDAWEEWVLYMLSAVQETSLQAKAMIIAMREALTTVKHQIRREHSFYSQDLINNLFMHPYTKIEHIMRDLQVSRITATKYLNALSEDGGPLQRHKIGRSYYYINTALHAILTDESF